MGDYETATNITMIEGGGEIVLTDLSDGVRLGENGRNESRLDISMLDIDGGIKGGIINYKVYYIKLFFSWKLRRDPQLQCLTESDYCVHCVHHLST